MSNSRRSLPAAALLSLAAAAAGTGALAQEATNTLGPPVLKDFTLPGERTVPPPATQPAQPPAATYPPSRRPAAETPGERPAVTSTRSAEPRPAPADPAPARQPAASAPATAEAPSATPPPQVPVAEAPAALPPQALPPAAETPGTRADADDGAGGEPADRTPLLVAAALAALAALGAFLFLRSRRRREAKAVERTRDSAREELGGALFAGERAPPKPAPAPRPSPTPEPEVAAAREAPRAWLEIDIKAERAAATETGATVHYELTLRNRGAETARNIRIDTRLLNASDEAAMAAFFEGPIHETSGSPHVTIAPDASLSLAGQVAMPKEELREIEVKGVWIFVPMVAINVAYDWGERGAGRTSRSWIVGRAGSGPDSKMGAFRLDLGPRIYRSVERREGRLVMV